LSVGTEYGTFFAPRAFEIDSAQLLRGEVFDLILHVVRWHAGRLDAVLEEIAATGKWDNAMVKHAYASQDELIKFKENAQNPRHSGIDAVHGVRDKSP
jgi:delta 1-pyrroline-5-carboxylate dehydrogenase